MSRWDDAEAEFYGRVIPAFLDSATHQPRRRDVPKVTQQSAMIKGLLALGYAELTATRYAGCRAFRHPDHPTRILFVGKGGSLRAGQNRTSSGVVSDRFKQTLLQAGGYKPVDRG